MYFPGREGISIAEKNAGHSGKRNTRAVGAYYEKKAAEYLRRQGYEILEHNFRCRLGEIDLIAREDGTLVFIEVKYRAGSSRGDPSCAVNTKKRMRISNAAAYYLYRNGWAGVSCRFDVVSITGEDLRLYRNAFEYAGQYFY